MRLPLSRPFAAIAAMALGAGLLTVTAPAQAATCAAPGLTSNMWTGTGDGTSFEDGANWSLGSAPDALSTDQVACIDAAGTVVMSSGSQANVGQLRLGTGTGFTIATGAKFYVDGDQATYTSTIEQGAELRLSGTYGGRGDTTLAGTLNWVKTLNGGTTLTSRDCIFYDPGFEFPPGNRRDCQPDDAVPQGGLLTVAGSGLFTITGPGGVNLYDHFRIDVYGRMVLRGDDTAYVSADRDTVTRLLPNPSGTGAGVFRIENNGGWYEGFDRGRSTLAMFQNAGTIVKAGGGGSSVIAADYAVSGAGSVAVFSGQLSLPGRTQTADPAATPAYLRPGLTYANGVCAGQGSYACAPITDSSDTQTASVTMTSADANGARVTLREGSVKLRAGDPGTPVTVEAAGMTPTRRKPSLLRLRYDASELNGATARTLKVFRKHGRTRYQRVPDCVGSTSRRIPRGSVACVDRKRGVTLPASDSQAGDVILVIRTTEFSRWLAR